MNRRGLLGAALGAFVADPERLLWVPGKKLISIPKAPMSGYEEIQLMLRTGWQLMNDRSGKPSLSQYSPQRLGLALLKNPEDNPGTVHFAILTVEDNAQLRRLIAPYLTRPRP
jgi:hypothetical protein